MPDLTPEQRAQRKNELLAELGDIHYEWVMAHQDNIDYNPERDSNPHDGETSDYNEHSLDRSATAEQEEDFQRRTQHILDELATL
jgi:hypothetical protein